MRFLLMMILLLAVGFLGWVAGSLYPAPASIQAPVKHFLANESSAADDAVSDDLLAPESEPTARDEIQSVVTPSGPDDTDAQYRAWIREARLAHPYPESEDKMYAVMMCESGGRADIVNPAGPYSGLFQYASGTWAGDWNQYRDSDILDARAQIFATALAWNQNMQSHWGCYSRNH
ncbi:MAG: hypothetical protein AAFW60_00185 [Pseudomonadota bacterium]